MNDINIDFIKNAYHRAEIKDYIHIDLNHYEVRIGPYGEADYYTLNEEEMNYILGYK